MLENMYSLDKDLAQKIMTEELGIPKGRTEIFLENFPLVHDPLAAAVRQYLKDRTISDIKIEGLTIAGIMDMHRTHFFEAVKGLNCLLRPGISQKDLVGFKKYLSSPIISF